MISQFWSLIYLFLLYVSTIVLYTLHLFMLPNGVQVISLPWEYKLTEAYKGLSIYIYLISHNIDKQ